MTEGYFSRLPAYSILRISGADAREFLQGQLSNDINLIDEQGWQWTAYHLPDGRVFALLLLFSMGGEFVACLPGTRVNDVVKRLGLYRLRADVTIETTPWKVYGVQGDCSSEFDAPLNALITAGLSVAISRDDPAPAANAVFEQSEPARWDLARLRAGIPFIGNEIQGRYVGQMLNLDLLPAISFAKGCFSGQEILARTHNLGRIKRRSFRFACKADCEIGDALMVGDQKAGEVVDKAAYGGDFECLALVRLEDVDKHLTLADRPVNRLPLPYESD